MIDESPEYKVVFDEKNKYYSYEPAANLHQLSSKQGYMMMKLRTQGHVFLNEVYDALGFPRTREGQFVGWIYRGETSQISFGIDDLIGSNIVGPITLTFNVDGLILDQLMSEEAARN